MDSKTDLSFDFCEVFGWYGDAECDEFCPKADPDCSEGVAICGGIAGLLCAEGEFCHWDLAAQCGVGDQTGTCLVRPDACALFSLPVCGCDGTDYPNECAANIAGSSVAATGQCDGGGGGGLPKTCGGIAGLRCGDNQYCHHEPGQLCGAADQLGLCKDAPDVCTREFAPVCGCDGATYGNACTANANGVSVAHTASVVDNRSASAAGSWGSPVGARRSTATTTRALAADSRMRQASARRDRRSAPASSRRCAGATARPTETPAAPPRRE